MHCTRYCLVKDPVYGAGQGNEASN